MQLWGHGSCKTWTRIHIFSEVSFLIFIFLLDYGGHVVKNTV